MLAPSGRWLNFYSELTAVSEAAIPEKYVVTSTTDRVKSGLLSVSCLKKQVESDVRGGGNLRVSRPDGRLQG
ncbi:MAG: hypothetical protein RIR52_402, partial [Acidobacteriota bacterium]